MSHDIEKWCKVWSKNDSIGSKNDIEMTFCEFWCEQWQAWKFDLSYATFLNSI